MNIKNLLKAALSVGLFVILSPFILVIAFATSLIWVPFVLLFSTPLAVTYLVLQKTPVFFHYLSLFHFLVGKSSESFLC